MQVQVRDISMAYSRSGVGRPLLLIHGYPLTRALWDDQVTGLAEYATVLAPDLRGHGGSQATDGPYSMELLADDLNAFLDAAGVDQPVVVCGLSMGGYIAFAFYRKYASRMAGLVLTSTRAPADSPEGKAGRDRAADLARREGANAIVEGMLPKLMAPENYSKQPELVSRLETILRDVSLQGILGDLVGMKERPDSTETLKKIRIPTLIVHGARDPIIPLSEAQSMQAAIHNANLVVIPDAGHLPNLEQPAAFNQAIKNYLEELP